MIFGLLLCTIYLFHRQKVTLMENKLRDFQTEFKFTSEEEKVKCRKVQRYPQFTQSNQMPHQTNFVFYILIKNEFHEYRRHTIEIKRIQRKGKNCTYNNSFLLSNVKCLIHEHKFSCCYKSYMKAF